MDQRRIPRQVIELSRRPAADKGKGQYNKGRAIKYIDSEMRVTDALQVQGPRTSLPRKIPGLTESICSPTIGNS